LFFTTETENLHHRILGKFKFKNKVGEEAVKEALKQGIKHLAQRMNQKKT